MKIRKTKNGFSFKGECSADYKALGNLVVELGKKDAPQKSAEAGEQQATCAAGRKHVLHNAL